MSRFRAASFPVDGQDLYRRVRDQIQAHVHFSDPRVFSLIAVWTIGTYAYTMFSHYGYLFVHSTLPQSGKTRLLEMLHHLAFQATVPLNAPTAASIRENAASGGTVLLDTLERWRDRSGEGFSAAMEMLDAGFRRGGAVVKMVPKGEGWAPATFRVFAPYGLAGINRNSLADTALDRSFVIEMDRKGPKIKKRAYYDVTCDRECQPIRDCLYAWALEHSRELWRVYQDENERHRVLNLRLTDRATDVWRPIFAVAKVLQLDSTTSNELITLAEFLALDPEAEQDRRRLEIVHALQAVTDGPQLRGQTEKLLILLAEKGLSITIKEFREVMTILGVEQHDERVNGSPRRVWRIDSARLADLEARLRSEWEAAA